MIGPNVLLPALAVSPVVVVVVVVVVVAAPVELNGVMCSSLLSSRATYQAMQFGYI